MKVIWAVLKDTFKQFFKDPVIRLSAATAYYSIFSIAPLLVLVIGLAGFIFSQDQIHNEVNRQLKSFVGPKATDVIQSMMSARAKHGSKLAVFVGTIGLIFGSTAVFVQLQNSLNTIWGVKAKPGRGLWHFIRDRLLSLAMILAVGFLLLVSMALTTLVNSLTYYIGHVAALPDWLAPTFETLISFLVIAILFALIFKVLPDVKILWRDVMVGAIGTSALFTTGKYLLGLYLSHETDISAYGAGSAFIIILLYVYYSSLILYLGAEFTQVYVRHHGRRIEPKSYATPVERSQVR